MKKILISVFTFISLFMVSGVCCFAAESEPNTTQEVKTMLSEAWGWIQCNYEKIISYAIDALVLLVGKMLFTRVKTQGASIGNLETSATDGAVLQKQIKDKLNEIIEVSNKCESLSEGLAEAEKRIEAKEDQIETLISSMFEMLTMIHVQNRNLPQGTKDRVTQIFSNAMRVLSDNGEDNNLTLALKSSYNLITSNYTDVGETVEDED